MLHLPDPLHPFAVHFPVAFLLLGGAGLAVSLLWPSAQLLRLSALMMVLGALGATWAHQTGNACAAEVRYVGESVAAAVKDHKGAADLMLWVSWLSACAAVAAFFCGRIPGLSLVSRLIAVGAFVLLLWTMQAALHGGSDLTHVHFFGPNAPKPLPGTEQVTRLRVE